MNVTCCNLPEQLGVENKTMPRIELQKMRKFFGGRYIVHLDLGIPEGRSASAPESSSWQGPAQLTNHDPHIEKNIWIRKKQMRIHSPAWNDP